MSSLWNYEQRYSKWSVYKRCCRPDVEQTRQQSTRVRLEWFGRIVNDRFLETIVWHTLYGGCTRTSRLCKTDFIMSLFFYVYNLRVRTEYSNRAFCLRPIGVWTQIVYWLNWEDVLSCVQTIGWHEIFPQIAELRIGMLIWVFALRMKCFAYLVRFIDFGFLSKPKHRNLNTQKKRFRWILKTTTLTVFIIADEQCF